MIAMVDPQRVGFWAQYPNEPMKHFQGKLRLREILEGHDFSVYPEYQLDEYEIEYLGPRQYREDLYCEHKTIEHWKFFCRVNGGVHFKSHKQTMKTNHRAKEIAEREKILAYDFTDEELIGKYSMSDAEIRGRLGLDIF